MSKFEISHKSSNSRQKTNLKKRRRRWFEFNEAKSVVDHAEAQWNAIEDRSFAWQILSLPKGFVCFHFGKQVAMDDRLHFVILLALARPKGALEYDMLEVDRIIWRRI